MHPEEIAQLIAALSFFGLLVICPLVMMFLRHQRQMAELIHGKGDNDALRRLEQVERELRELRALRHEQVIGDDDQRELSRRIT